MPALLRHPGIVASAGFALGAGMVLGVLGWPEPDKTVLFVGLLAAAALAATQVQRSPASYGATMSPSFAVEFASLLLLGPTPAVLVATTGAVTQILAASGLASSFRRTLLSGATTVVATLTAAAAHQALGGTIGDFSWPWQGLPIAATVLAYCLVKFASAELVAPLITKNRVNRAWPARIFRHCPLYFIAATVVVAAVEMFAHQAWAVLPAVALPIYFLCRAYFEHVNRLDDEHRDQQVVETSEQGVAAIDLNGRITIWNQALERLVKYPREQALGRVLLHALPALERTELPRAVNEALTGRTPRTVPQVTIPSGAGTRILQVTLVPIPGGVMMLWDDVTQRTRADQVLRRSEERLALAAEGATDGLWEWNLRNQEFYFSARMWAMIGLRMPDGTCRPEEWFERVHPDDIAGLKEAIDAHLSGRTGRVEHEHRIRHADATYRWFICRGVAVSAAGRRATRIAGSLTDTTDRVLAQERLRSAGFTDPLTGVGNRAVFVEGLGRRLDDLKQRRGEGRFAVLYLDLDRFKVVNDSLGHLIGDQLLTAVSRRLESCLRPGDALARMGGDEFAILLNGLADEQQANAIAFRIQNALSAPVQIGGREVFTSASIGIAFGLSQYTSPDEIMRDADTAMYHAKSRGRARHELFDADMHERARNRLGIENDLRHAVNNKDFEVHYQPIVNLASRRCVGFEALIRWNRHGKVVSPATFIPIAEELGLIEPIGTWVLQQACDRFAAWQRQFPGSGLEFITVNVSSRQLMQPNFLSIVEQAGHDAGLKPNALRIEITETALMESPNVVAEVLRELRKLGVRIYLDDFGTGYSSLSHLHKLPVDALKIDRSFVMSLQLADRPAIVESILALARTLNTSVVAEGIESAEQASQLARLGCTHAQGYLFSRPLSTQAVGELLVVNQPLGPAVVQAANSPDIIVHESDEYDDPVPFKWSQPAPVQLLSSRE